MRKGNKEGIASVWITFSQDSSDQGDCFLHFNLLPFKLTFQFYVNSLVKAEFFLLCLCLSLYLCLVWSMLIYVIIFYLSACHVGNYGADCEEMCSNHCAGSNSSCNNINGICDQGCELGYQLPHCLEGKTSCNGNQSLRLVLSIFSKEEIWNLCTGNPMDLPEKDNGSF